jgi:hypothetical protein
MNGGHPFVITTSSIIPLRFQPLGDLREQRPMEHQNRDKEQEWKGLLQRRPQVVPGR